MLADMVLKNWSKLCMEVEEDAMVDTRRSFLETCSGLKKKPTCETCERPGCCYQDELSTIQ